MPPLWICMALAAAAGFFLGMELSGWIHKTFTKNLWRALTEGCGQCRGKPASAAEGLIWIPTKTYGILCRGCAKKLLDDAAGR